MEIILDSVGTLIKAKRPQGNITDVVNAGFHSLLMDMRMVCGEGMFLHMTRARRDSLAEGDIFLPDEPERIGEAVQPTLDACREQKVSVQGAMAPMLPLDRTNPDMNNYQRALAFASVRWAIENHCEWCVVSPLFVGIPLEEEKAINLDYYRSFLPILKEHPDRKFKILLENECRDHGGHLVRGILSDPYDAREWLSELNASAREQLGYDAFGFCLNIGHVNVCGQDLDEITPVLKDDICAVILTDNSGNEISEMLPFSSVSRSAGAVSAGANTDWLSVIRGLRKIHYDGPVIFAMADTLVNYPVFIRAELLRFAKSVADFFVWQLTMEQTIAKYSHIVLFGAGNMCRNYMMDYGEKYPPLFTCDNNSKRWGEEFCGLKIESPEKLKDLPEGTGIFICNEFYTEIRTQLESMGVSAGIEYYSDRYPNTEARKRLKGLWK